MCSSPALLQPLLSFAIAALAVHCAAAPCLLLPFHPAATIQRRCTISFPTPCLPPATLILTVCRVLEEHE